MATDLSFFRSESAQRLRAQALAEGLAQGLERGRTEQAVRSVLIVLTERGVELSTTQHSRLSESTDLEQLEVWLVHALTATDASELFV
ncbi:hypothetical protein OG225_31650 [Nocardia sp. NBC_01377]|uniref:hypothetical protein n=1 Tax=Nocardia sp. NBC_01377 TaxID=2903595 RepID=UPI003245F891